MKKILITNDDGIYSRGIKLLAKTLKQIGKVTVAAPLTEQSAVGHSITMKYPLRISKVYENGEFFGYAIDGTPADCVKMGIRNIMKEKPDLVVSGINHGSYVAINIIYSGTVSAAREAAIMDAQAIAISLANHKPVHLETAAKAALIVSKFVLENPLPNGVILNVNVPDIAIEHVKGFLFTKQGLSKWDDYYEERMDPYGNNYYWLKGEMLNLDDKINADIIAVKNNFISITPIHFDLTEYSLLEKLQDKKLDFN